MSRAGDRPVRIFRRNRLFEDGIRPWAVPDSVTRRISEGDHQEAFDLRLERPGLLLGFELSQDIERRTPSLTRRVAGTANERMHTIEHRPACPH